MSARRKRSHNGTAALVWRAFGVVALAGEPASAQQELQVCQQAVAPLLAGAVKVDAREDTRVFGFGERTVSWRGEDGSSGVCRIDGQGRVFGVEVQSFGRAPGAAPGWAAYSVTCESHDGRRRECQIASPSQVTLERKLSRGDCNQGQSWGFYRERLWVDDGCRGVFRVSPVAAAAPGFTDDAAIARAARSACERKVTMQGMELISAEAPRRVDRLRWQMDLRVATRGIRFAAVCTYQEKTGHVEIAGK
jgi:hypothetical protein